MDEKLHKYKRIADEAIYEVFQQDYFGLLGLPIPIISFLSKEVEQYHTGEYFIKIGKNWQIHLNFGKLPESLVEFKREVKVLVRHEIEHYQTCPFDVISQFRMVKTILETNSNHSHSLSESTIKSIAGSIANQVADIIVDSKNYNKYPADTLESEINWIKKGCDDSFQNVSRNGKLMFLMKERIWDVSLDIHEKDESLLQNIKTLSENFLAGGIDNRSMFLEKTSSYTNLLLDLIELDKNDFESQGQSRTGGESNLVNEPGSSYQSAPNSIPCKDDNEGNGQLIYQNQESVTNAINQLAQETTIEEFSTILDALGIDFNTEKEKKKIWFEQNNIESIPLPIEKQKNSENDISFPDVWKIGEPIEELDMLLTYQTSPKILPGISTKRWRKQYNPIPLENKGNTDLLLVIDTSGSMGDDTNSKTRLHQAILASFGFLKYFEDKNGKVALVNFSTTPIFCNWTRDYDSAKDTLLIRQGSSTNFPIGTIEQLTEKKKEGTVIVIITDGEISNWQEVINHFSELLQLGNDIFLFLMDNKKAIEKYSDLRNFGGYVEFAQSATEIRNLVFNHIDLK